jgi:hypothetical protein
MRFAESWDRIRPCFAVIQESGEQVLEIPGLANEHFGPVRHLFSHWRNGLNLVSKYFIFDF